MPTQVTKNSSIMEKLKDIPVFLPISPFIIFWYFLLLIIMLLSFAFTVVFICFQSEEAEAVLWGALLPIMLVIMGLDILISFNISFIKNGRIILNRTKIAKNYIFSLYFYLDVIAFVIVLIQIILKDIFQDEITGLNFLIYIKVIKGVSIDKLIKKYILKSASLILYYQMVKNLLLLALVCHVIGSFFFYLDLVLIRDQWYGQSDLWIYNSYAYLNIKGLPVGWQYVYSFYYAVVTLSGTAYGDLVPLNQTQTAYTFGSIALPMIIYAYLFSVIYNAISERRSQAIQATKYKKIAKYYFRDLGINQNLSIKLINYLTYVYDKKVSIDNDFLQNLAPSLRNQYLKTVIDDSFNFKFFNILCRPEFEIDMLKNIIYNCIQEETFPDQYVISHRKHKIKLFFINTGKVHEIVELKQKKFIKQILTRNFFMAYPFFTGINSMPKNNWYQVKNFTICQVIDYDQFMKEVRNYPILRETLSILRNQIISGYNHQLLQLQCFFCDSNQHILSNCPKLRPEINISECIKRDVKRNHRGKFYYRKQYHTQVSQFRSGSKNKVYFQEQSLLARKVSLVENETQKQTQTEDLVGQKWRINTQALKQFEGIKEWKVYFTQFNNL